LKGGIYGRFILLADERGVCR